MLLLAYAVVAPSLTWVSHMYCRISSQWLFPSPHECWVVLLDTDIQIRLCCNCILLLYNVVLEWLDKTHRENCFLFCLYSTSFLSASSRLTNHSHALSQTFLLPVSTCICLDYLSNLNYPLVDPSTMGITWTSPCHGSVALLPWQYLMNILSRCTHSPDPLHHPHTPGFHLRVISLHLDTLALQHSGWQPSSNLYQLKLTDHRFCG